MKLTWRRYSIAIVLGKDEGPENLPRRAPALRRDIKGIRSFWPRRDLLSRPRLRETFDLVAPSGLHLTATSHNGQDYDTGQGPADCEGQRLSERSLVVRRVLRRRRLNLPVRLVGCEQALEDPSQDGCGGGNRPFEGSLLCAAHTPCLGQRVQGGRIQVDVEYW